MISKAFAALVARTAVGEYSLSAQSGLLEPQFGLNQSEIERLVSEALGSYGYQSRKAAMDDIFELSGCVDLQFGEAVASVNMLRSAPGDILRLSDAAGNMLRLLCVAPARLLVLAHTSAALIYGDILRPLTPVIGVGDRAIFAVVRDGYSYPSDTRYFCIAHVNRIEIAPNDASDIFAGAGDSGREVPHADAAAVYVSHGNHGAQGFDAEDFVDDATSALFRIDFAQSGATYCFNTEFHINYEGLAPEERRSTHDACLAEVIRMCELEGEAAPLHRLVTLTPGTLVVKRRPDGFATLVIDRPARIKSL